MWPSNGDKLCTPADGTIYIKRLGWWCGPVQCDIARNNGHCWWWCLVLHGRRDDRLVRLPADHVRLSWGRLSFLEIAAPSLSDCNPIEKERKRKTRSSMIGLGIETGHTDIVAPLYNRLWADDNNKPWPGGFNRPWKRMDTDGQVLAVLLSQTRRQHHHRRSIGLLFLSFFLPIVSTLILF